LIKIKACASEAEDNCLRIYNFLLLTASSSKRHLSHNVGQNLLS